MEFKNLSKEELKQKGIPTFNNGEHYLLESNNEQETVVINVGNGNYLTVSVVKNAKTVDVKMHSEHKFQDLGEIKAFYDYE
ncbi:hypothetical protein [Alkalibacillus aidingensis]|uniref:hypothetical protein n=1 Tax=Alkalibacillus aidingensis TaxID=2747607 RepID=UPI00166065DD|nr:hypothetical protein [Alkalibacillus aidingensis]